MEDTINEAMTKYYELKMKYDNEITKIKTKIKDEFKTVREKRRAFNKIKPKCVNCHRPVKTIFKTIYNPTTTSRNLIAKCGDLEKPCGLNININIGHCEILTDSIKLYEDSLNVLKNDIIKEKNMVLFGYVSDYNAVENFETMKDRFISYLLLT